MWSNKNKDTDIVDVAVQQMRIVWGYDVYLPWLQDNSLFWSASCLLLRPSRMLVIRLTKIWQLLVKKMNRTNLLHSEYEISVPNKIINSCLVSVLPSNNTWSWQYFYGNIQTWRQPTVPSDSNSHMKLKHEMCCFTIVLPMHCTCGSHKFSVCL